MDMLLNKCGVELSSGRFYDRKGDFFREGVDPRNHFGRFVEVERGHDDGCAAMYSYAERCICSMNPRDSWINGVVDNKVYWLSDSKVAMRKTNA